MSRFSDAQMRVLRFWREYTDAHDYAPTIREAMPALGLHSTNAAHQAVERVINREALRRIARNAARAVVLTELGYRLTGGPRGAVVVEFPTRCPPCGNQHFRRGKTLCFNCEKGRRA